MGSIWVMWLAACSLFDPLIPPALAPQEPADGTPADGEAPVEPAKLGDLAPVITPTAGEGEAPSSLSISLVRPLQPESTTERPAEGTTLRIEPPVEGDLVWSDARRLVFRPDVGFQPGVTYTATLEALAGAPGPVDIPADARPTLTFTTPAFAATRAVVVSANPATRLAEVDVVFSGPVEEGSVTPDVRVNDVAADAELSRPQPNRIRYAVPIAADHGTIRLSIGGARSAVDPASTAPAVKLDVPYDARFPAVDLKALRRVETGEGWMVEVVCHDPAAGEAEYWRDVNAPGYAYHYLSPRCALDAERALDVVHVSPPVDHLRVVEASGGFRIFGDFGRGSYTVRIDAGARTVDGGGFRATVEQAIEIPARTSRVEMVASQGRYLPRNAWTNLPIRHMNVDHVELEIRHVPPQNLVYWLAQDGEGADSRTSDLVVDTKVPVSGEPDVLATTWVDLGKLMPGDQRGVYEVRLITPKPPEVPEEEADEPEVEDTDGGWVPPPPPPQQDASRLVLTDLNLVAKADAIPPGRHWSPRIHVWALDMGTAGARSGVDVEAVRPSGKVMARCTTGRDGGCVLELPETDVDPQPPVAIVASSGDDMTYLRFEDLRIGVSEDKVAGEPYLSDVPYRASLWTERGVYRPGETIHLAAALRDRGNTAPDDQLPVTVKFRDSRHKTVKSTSMVTNAGGLVAADLALPAFAATGSWEASLEVAGKVVGTQKIAVEEFVPERMRVTATPTVKDALASAQLPFDVSARYLFGGSAAGSPVEVACRIEPAPYAPGGRDEYTWGVEPRVTRPDEEVEDGAYTLGTANAEIGQDDTVRVTCPPIDPKPVGPSRLVAEIAVFEAGSGRTTRAEASVRIHPDPVYVGLRSGVAKGTAGQPIPVGGIAVDWDGKPVAGRQITVEIADLQEEWGWWHYWDWEEYREGWLHHLRPSFVERRTVQTGADGRFELTFTPQGAAAGYQLTAIADGARTELAIEGTSRGWYSGPGGEDQTPRPLAPTSLAVTLPESAVVGQEIPVEVVAPWPGRVLFTVETDHVLASEWVDVGVPGPVKWSWEPEAYAPNVYVSALLVKDPHLLSAASYVPDRAFGVRSIRVDPTQYQLAVNVSAPDEIRSNSVLDVDVDLGPQSGPSWITVAAVDEGILALTRFPSPDPIPELFPTRALGVDTFETIGWTMMLPAAGTSSSTGGDAEGLAGRVQPVKAVALWSGLVEVDPSGKASVALPVPQYRGELRIMVVAANADRVGSAVDKVVVRDPLVVQTTLPRFLVAGDDFQVPVFVTNTSGKSRNVTVKLATEPLAVPGIGVVDPIAPLQLASKSEATFTLRDGESRTVAFAARAIAPVGAAKLRVVATADGGLTSFDELDVPFAPAGPRERRVQKITLAAGSLDLSTMLDGWVPTTESTRIWVTPNPYGESMGHLDYLLHYPYGCIEQTTSATRPLLYVRNLLPAVNPKLADPEKIDDMVEHGVERILSMQTSSGGFGYWPGDTTPVFWGSAYATHVLLDAKAQGYAIPQERLDDAIAWLGREADKNAGSRASDLHYGWIDAEAYTHYVLARAGRPRKARIESLLGSLDRRRQESVEDAYLLKAALYLAGDRRYEKDLRNPDSSPVRPDRHNHWGFWSDLRARGMMLSTYHDVFGDGDAGADALANVVARGLSGSASQGYTTQEIVWGTTGLGKRVKALSTGFGEPVVKANGRALSATKGGADRSWEVWRASELSSLTLDVPSTGTGALYLVLASQGVREGAKPALGGNGLTVTREWLDGDGDAIDFESHALGDLVYTRVRVTNKTGERLQNLALVDRLPAGWEIENPRLGRGTTADWIEAEKLWEADHMNLRDDRLELFGELDPGETREVVYAVRAVTAGRFTIPPVEVEAMYDPTLWARAPGVIVEIDGPWADVLL